MKLCIIIVIIIIINSLCDLSSPLQTVIATET